MEWTDQQLVVVINAACAADNGRWCAISEVLKAFIEFTSFDLLDRMEQLYIPDNCPLSEDSTWQDIMPMWSQFDLFKPTNKNYLMKI